MPLEGIVKLQIRFKIRKTAIKMKNYLPVTP